MICSGFCHWSRSGASRRERACGAKSSSFDRDWALGAGGSSGVAQVGRERRAGSWHDGQERQDECR